MTLHLHRYGAYQGCRSSKYLEAVCHFLSVKDGQVTVVVPRASSIFGADARFAEAEFQKMFEPISL